MGKSFYATIYLDTVKPDVIGRNYFYNIYTEYFIIQFGIKQWCIQGVLKHK